MQISNYKEGVKLYNSQNTSSEMVKNSFVIRIREYNKLWKAIINSDMEHPEQHYIVQGVRGAGKTTMLRRLAIAVEESEELTSWLIPITFKEEEYGISSLFTFWERIAEELAEYDHTLFDSLFDTIDQLKESEIKQLISLINQALIHSQKKIILFIDNIAELFEQFDQVESDMLREILTTNNNIRIIGGSAIRLEAFFDNKAPFYQFFDIHTLQGLKEKETTALLKKLSEHAGEKEQKNLNNLLEKEPQKIESIRRLTGGIPRTISILFNILVEGPKGNTFTLLEETIDKTTPLYKHRMDDLTAQQKPIVNAIALNWDGISVKEIAEKIRLPSKQVSAQLRQLEKQWIIEKTTTNTKNHLYALKERFFNIWYLMRYGRRKDRRKVLWLTQFMEIWCTGDELKQRSKLFTEHLKGNCHPLASITLANAFICSDKLTHEDKNKILSATSDYLQESGNGKLHKELLSLSDEDTNSEVNKLWQELLEFEENLAQEKLDKLKSFLQKTKHNYGLGLFYIKIKEFTKAEKCLLNVKTADGVTLLAFVYKAQDKLNLAITTAKIAITKESYIAYKLLAEIYLQQENFTKATEYYLLAIKHDIPDCYIELSDIYLETSQLALAEKYALLAIEHREGNAHVKLGEIYIHLDKFDKAKEILEKELQKKSFDGVAYGFLAWIHLHQNNMTEAKKYLQLGLKQNSSGISVVAAYFYYCEKDYRSAKPYLLQSIKEGATSMLSILASIYQIEGNLPLAEEYYLKALSSGNESAEMNLADFYFYNMQTENKVKALVLAKKSIKANTTFEAKNSYISILLWNNNFELATQIMESLLKNITFEDQEQESQLIQLFTLFLAKEQTNLVDRWFKKYDIKERFKPLYYALMSLMKEQYPNETLRMGSELTETVNEIL
ncbi:MAG: tetratricopeptide repeat protein, partial [Colwellia sp.]|nr:tetratricopeptide repeat protein [Colwellia sp.]